MNSPRKKWFVDYRLWVYDNVLGFHLTIFTRWYYTKIGARLDRYQLKRSSLKRSEATPPKRRS